MKARTRFALAAPALGFATMIALAGPASAADGSAQGTLAPVALNGVDGGGTAMTTINGTTLTVDVHRRRPARRQPARRAHPLRRRGAARVPGRVATTRAATGTLNTTEGGPAYGDIVVSLTKTGDTSPKSGLAVDRFDTAKGGKINYQRGSIKISDDVAKAIVAGQSAVVIHGVDHNHDGKYDGDTKSDLDPSLPTEATDPALCGVLAVSQMSATPSGGAQTGSGSTAGVQDAGLLAAGGVALAAGALLIARRRRVTADATVTD